VQTGSLQIQAEFPNPANRLRPGGYAKVRALIDDRKNAIVVPPRAVQEVQGKHQVVVVGKDDVAEIRPVTVGPRTGDFWVIDKGLEAGDRVVVEGLQKARNGTKVAAKPFVPPS
jgi:membrane fusion protein (multidrug efflux system)